MIKVGFCRKLLNIGLIVQKLYDRLSEAMAFLRADIPGILTVRTVIDRLQIVRRVSGGSKEALFTAPEDIQLFFQRRKSALVSVQQLFAVLH